MGRSAEHDRDGFRAAGRSTDVSPRQRRLQELLDEIQSTTTDEDRAAVRRIQDEMYDDNGLPT